MFPIYTFILFTFFAVHPSCCSLEHSRLNFNHIARSRSKDVFSSRRHWHWHLHTSLEPRSLTFQYYYNNAIIMGERQRLIIANERERRTTGRYTKFVAHQTEPIFKLRSADEHCRKRYGGAVAVYVSALLVNLYISVLLVIVILICPFIFLIMQKAPANCREQGLGQQCRDFANMPLGSSIRKKEVQRRNKYIGKSIGKKWKEAR